MAITFNSLTPLNPTATAGSPITFTVSATTDDGGTLSYLWQFSGDGGVTYLNAPGTNNATTYVTSNLTANENGLYVRVKVTSSNGSTMNSNDASNIGNRIISVTLAPFILVITEPDSPSYTLNTGVNQELLYEATLQNVDNTVASNISGLTAQWQISTDNGGTYTNLNDGDVTGTTSYTVTTTTVASSSNPVFYFKRSILTIVGTSFGINNYKYRLKWTLSSGASNSPLYTDATTIVINPIITIFSQPGQAVTDTKQTNCYKTTIANSGKAQLSVSALTSAGTGLSYKWEFSYLTSVTSDGTEKYSDWIAVDDGTAASGVSRFWMAMQTGFTANAGTLKLAKLIYFEKILFRCTLTGSNGELAVTTNSATIWMTDDITYPSALGNKSALEDYYGDIANRSSYTNYAIQNVVYNTSLITSRNNGLNGTVTMKLQRQNPGSTTWQDVGVTITSSPQYTPYSATPATLPTEDIDIDYTTPALRRDDGAGNQQDHNSKYRVYVTSTAVYTLNGTGYTATKTLTPIISAESTLSVYRQVFITGQPVDVGVYNNQPAAFSVVAQPSSGSTLTYQWQYNTANKTTGWVNITSLNAGSLYSGYNSSLLSITQATKTMTYKFYRCILNTNDTLNTTTTSVAKINISEDTFSQLSDIQDFYVNEFSPVSWTVTAVSLSLGTISYQWQKSTNYNPLTPGTATWSNISGATSATYGISSVDSPGDLGYYRCRCTSAGSYIDYTNAAKLSVTALEIQITSNLPSTFTVLEALEAGVTFSISATATVGNAPVYQWQYSSDSGTTWTNFGTGYNGQESKGSSFTPNPFSVTDNGIKVRCKLTADSIPGEVYSNVATLTVIRRFTYFADSAIKNVQTGGIFVLDLQPTFTGGSPTYQWYKNGAILSGQTASILSVTSPVDGDKYKCLIGLTSCTQHRYNRNNTDFIVSATSSTYTVDVEVNVVPAAITPSRYTKETAKNGAAIGTVIAIPKPAGYVDNPSATTDDISQWGCARTGNPNSLVDTNGGISHDPSGSSGAYYIANKPAWVTDTGWKSPKWYLKEDRFPGFIELRGQWIKVEDFPLLYRVIGDTYGSKTVAGKKVFRLPQPYGKKLMGTGNVDNNSGTVSIVPVYGANGLSGGDKNVPGTIGGVYNFLETKQLPPGSPGISSKPDGTAGIGGDAGTFTIGTFQTEGFTEVQGTGNTKFSGTYKFTIGPVIEQVFVGTPVHAHAGISAAWKQQAAHTGGCWNSGVISPTFYSTESDGGEVLSGPQGIAEGERGISHTHSLYDSAQDAGNNQSANEQPGMGDTTGKSTWSQTLDLPFINYTGTTNPNPSFGLFLEPAPATLSSTSKTIFNNSLKFTLRNNKPLPLLAPYFRLKYLIKAY